jgi:hypothetical protein
MTSVAGWPPMAYTKHQVLVTPYKAASPPRQRGIFVPVVSLHGRDAPSGNGGRPDFIQVTNIPPSHPLEMLP